jgi:uncharacterized membrane protein
MELTVVDFKGRSAAALAFGALHERAGDAHWKREVALLEHHRNNRIALFGMVAGHYVSADEEDHLSKKGAVVGGLIGAALGVALGPPAVAAGFVAGGAIGAEFASPDEVEKQPGALVERLRAEVPQGHSAIVMLAEPDHVEQMLAVLAPLDADVRRETLSNEELGAIDEALRYAPVTGLS